jgi:aldose 1-epimerase
VAVVGGRDVPGRPDDELMAAPSGQQLEIRHGDQRAVVVSVGGGVREYAVGDRPVLDGYAESAMCDGARCQTLVPWPNRVKDGAWSWRGKRQQLALTEPEQHNAIHGLVRWLGWTVAEHTDSAVTVECVSHPQPGYPWTIGVRNRWSLDDTGLRVQTTISNRSDTAVPVAAGFHPYITVGTPTIDDAFLSVPAAAWLPTGEQQIPTGREPVVGTAYDFNQPRRLGDVKIDYTLTDLRRDDDGKCRLRLAHPDGSPTVTVWVGEAFRYLELFTGDGLPDPTRRRQGLGVEPMSAPPNAFATGESLAVVEPGVSWHGEWGIDPF